MRGRHASGAVTAAADHRVQTMLGRLRADLAKIEDLPGPDSPGSPHRPDPPRNHRIRPSSDHVSHLGRRPTPAARPDHPWPGPACVPTRCTAAAARPSWPARHWTAASRSCASRRPAAAATPRSPPPAPRSSRPHGDQLFQLHYQRGQFLVRGLRRRGGTHKIVIPVRRTRSAQVTIRPKQPSWPERDNAHVHQCVPEGRNPCDNISWCE